MRTLVTGGAGFIGSHLVDALLGRGEVVSVVDDLSSGRRENLAAAIEAGATLDVLDIRDREALSAATERFRPEVVFHLAAQMDVRRSVADPYFDATVNVAGTANLLECARQTGCRRFVFASTGGAIYGEGAGLDLPLPEDAPARPMSPYGQSKLAAEGYLELYRRLYDLDGISLRLGNVYGPRQDPHGEAGVVAIFAGKIRDGDKPTAFGTGEQTRDYIYVGDVVEAFLAAADGGAPGPLNVGTGREASVLELVEIMGRHAGRDDFRAVLAPAREGEVERIAIDPARARAELGWIAEVPLERGLGLTLDALL